MEEAKEREENIKFILHVDNIDKNICEKFDNVGCQYINYKEGRLYRRNNRHYYINYTDDRIFVFDENMEPLEDSMEVGWSTFDHCYKCGAPHDYWYQPDRYQKKVYISEFLNNVKKPLHEILGEKTYTKKKTKLQI